MHNGLSFHQTTFLALPHQSYIIFNHPVMGKTILLRQKLQQTYNILTELQLNLQIYINISCCIFNEISVNRRKLCCKKFDL